MAHVSVLPSHRQSVGIAFLCGVCIQILATNQFINCIARLLA